MDILYRVKYLIGNHEINENRCSRLLRGSSFSCLLGESFLCLVESLCSTEVYYNIFTIVMQLLVGNCTAERLILLILVSYLQVVCQCTIA